MTRSSTRSFDPTRGSTPPFTTVLVLLAGVLAVTASAMVATESTRGPQRFEREVTPRGALLPAERHLTELFREASRSVVHITSLRLRRSFTRDVYRVPEGSGSGFVWDTEGHIVTNYHVIQNGTTYQVVLADESTWEAKLVGSAPHKDLAVLKVEAPADALKPLALGTSSDLLVGQNVSAIGNPFGLDQSLTRGVISALGREITSRMRTTIYDVIQTDAAVNPGNSGGPLLDSAGRLVGVNTAIFSPSGVSAGISFAIPVDTVRRVVPDLIAFGRVQKPVIGFRAYPEKLPRNFPRGVLVVDVPERSVLESAGLRGTTESRLGDIIVAINERPTPTLSDLESVLERYRAGDAVKLTLVRGLDYDGDGGRRIEIETELQSAEESRDP